MSSFKVLMILILGVYSNASPSDSDKGCEGNIPCELKALDHPQEETNNSPHQRARRSLSNPCESETEVAPFVYIDPNTSTPQTLMNEIVTRKIEQTRCVREGVECLEHLSILEGKKYICRPIITHGAYSTMIEGEMIEVSGGVKAGCECVYDE